MTPRPVSSSPGSKGKSAAWHRPKALRCAIYTRVSTDQGLEQDFNSLDAQREASESYIKSQAHEGWWLIRDAYDDGGYSGGSMERPALQRLLQDIREGFIDIVVVYKVDRLTRSLADFAKLVELFDEYGVSFVSVTQSFNTTSSMGRLTLNVLLSFAQFEREVTAERIRDKIAASKKKGLWMGGNVPLGYRVADRKLLIEEVEAQIVRRIFARYLDLGSLTALAAELRANGVASRPKILSSGKAIGGGPISVGALAHILKNRMYLGEINHKGQSYPGKHEAIIDTATFDQVQRQLAAQAHEKHLRSPQSALLLGKIYDDRGNRMTPSHAKKEGVRYRYYVSCVLAQGRKAEAGTIKRVPAPEVETQVVETLRQAVCANVQNAESAMDRADLGHAHTLGEGQDAAEPAFADHADLVARHVDRVIIRKGIIEIIRKYPDHEYDESSPDDPSRTRRRKLEPIQISWSPPGRARKKDIIAPAAATDRPGIDANRLMPFDIRKTLLVSIAKARAWMREILASHDPTTIARIAQREECSERHVRMLLPLANLAPSIIEDAIADRLPHHAGVSNILADMPLVWTDQRRALGLREV